MNFLVITKLETNNHKSDFIDVVSFLVTKNYLSRFDLESVISYFQNMIFVTRREIRRVDRFVEKIENVKQHLRKKLQWAQVKQIKYDNRYRHVASEFKIENMIIFDKRNIKINRFNHSLNYKNLDLYKIVEIINNYDV